MQANHLLLTTLLLAAPLAAQDTLEPTPLTGTAYGAGSGDQVLPGMGLNLELVRGDSAAPGLRLSGGLPGNGAAIACAFESAEHIVGGRTYLVPAGSATVQGVFDVRGRFEISVASWVGFAEDGAGLYVQGAEIGTGFSDVHELSHGLHVLASPAEPSASELTFALRPADGQFSLLNPVANVPDLHTLEVQESLQDLLAVESVHDVLLPDLDELLGAALEHAGDALTLKLNVKGSVAIVAVGNVGGDVTLELAAERLPDGCYELRFQRKGQMTIGAEAWEDTEVQAAAGLEIVEIYRFSNLPGLVQGVRGLAMIELVAASGVFPDLAPGLVSMSMPDLSLVGPVTAAQQVLIGAEAVLQNAELIVVALLHARNAAWNAYVHAPWWKKPAWYAAYVALHGAHKAAATVVPPAAQVVHAAGSALSDVFRALNALWQPIRYARDHHVAREMGLPITAELSLSLCPVDIGTVDAGGKVQKEQKLRTRIENRQSPQDPWVIDVALSIEFEEEGMLGFLAAGKVTCKQELEIAARGEMPSFFGTVDLLSLAGNVLQSSESTLSAKLTLDTLASALVGLVAYGQAGYGRTVTLEVEHADAALGRIGDLLSAVNGDTSGLLDSLGGIVLRMGLQDRMVAGWGLQAGGSYAGYGLGIDEASLLWDEVGPACETEVTLAEAIELIAEHCMPQ